jgi:NADPH:quinone reductase
MHALVTETGVTGPRLVETEVPEPGRGQVRIAVAAAAVNPIDVFTASGSGLVDFGLAAPRSRFGLGWDVAGTVDAVGPGVSGLGTGEAVIGLADRLTAPTRTHAEYVVLDATAVTRAPRDTDPVAASTLALNALTALQALDVLELAGGQTLLVTGAAGAVGGYAIELAKLRGLAVVGVAGADDEDLVTGLGADVFVPRSPDLDAAVRALVPGGVDGAIDPVGLGIAAAEPVRNRGSFAAVVGGRTPLPLRGQTAHTVFVDADATQLAELVTLVESGKLSLRVADSYPLADAATAYTRLSKGGVRGRLVLIP